MSLKVLIVPDKFKGTLTAHAAAQAIACGWHRERPHDVLTLLPMTDGGDGFGEVMSRLLKARPQQIRTVDAAHRPCVARWWWDKESKSAIVEAAQVVGLAMLPHARFHPFALDTFGLGKVLQAARTKGARQILIGIGGSATNDGGFGLARALGWQFLTANRRLIESWAELHQLVEIIPPPGPGLGCILVAMDVQNPLLGMRGATRVYGPQKGLGPEDFPLAESNLKRLASVAQRFLSKNSATDVTTREIVSSLRNHYAPAESRNRIRVEGAVKDVLAKLPGAGAAGGLGFGLLAFLDAKPEAGFELFARHAKLDRCLKSADLVITGEGSIDRSTLMGKGTGEIARRCQLQALPCLGLAGCVTPGIRYNPLFQAVRAMTNLTSERKAKARPADWLAKLAAAAARGLEMDQPRPRFDQSLLRSNRPAIMKIYSG